MASINGVTVKAIKVFKDHEGLPVAQGNVYFNGKKLGFWSQDSWGGPDNFDFNEKVLDNVVDQYRKSSLVDPEYKDIVSAESLISEIIGLTEDEKQYKKMLKQGYVTYVVWSDRGLMKGYFTKTFGPLIKETAYFKKFCADCGDPEGKKVKVYSGLDDFNLDLADFAVA